MNILDVRRYTSLFYAGMDCKLCGLDPSCVYLAAMALALVAGRLSA